MRIHHLSCGAIRPRGWGAGGGLLTNHCVLVETPSSLVLIDSGFGMRDVLVPRGRLSPWYLALMRPQLGPEATAVRQVRRLGYDPRDVQHIILSHLDCDRVGGVDDFPDATVHVRQDELARARERPTWTDRMRYRPAQWTSRGRWRTYLSRGETFAGFLGVHALSGLPPEILMVPLPGHTVGHAGVVIRTSTSWLVYAGDAYISHRELDEPSLASPGLRFLHWMFEHNRRARLRTVERLRMLARSSCEVAVFSAHDRTELELPVPPPPPPAVTRPRPTSRPPPTHLAQHEAG